VPHSDLVVVGGGIIGVAIAREAALAGLSVSLIERRLPGCEASAAAAGMLTAQADAESPGPLLPLCLASRDLYPDFARAVHSESGVDPCLVRSGLLVLARTPAEADGLDRRLDFQRSLGLDATRVSGPDLRHLEPSLSAEWRDGLFLPEDSRIDAVLLMRALVRAALKAGSRVHSGVRVTRLLVDGGKVVGVETAAGRFPAAAVVIAAGAWSGELEGEGISPLATHPVRGQIVCFGAPRPAIGRPLMCGTCYLVPRGADRILVGSTMERAGFDRSVTAEGLATLTAAALDVVPALRSCRFESAWAGLRPATDDGLPAIGPGAAPGLFYACGHLRSGILLAPITARAVARLVRGEDPGIDLAPFSPLRFAGARPASGGARRPPSHPAA
jgi:glycine oxidase